MYNTHFAYIIIYYGVCNTNYIHVYFQVTNSINILPTLNLNIFNNLKLFLIHSKWIWYL